MKIVAGCDVGSLTSKAVIMRHNKIVAWQIIKSKPNPKDSANAVMETVLAQAGLAMDDIECCVGTGYGQAKISFVHESDSEIFCHGRGARWMLPSAGTVIDIGGQDCKAMRLDNRGNLENFVANDKCASGTGRFLEVMARLLNVDISDLGGMTSISRQPVTLTSTCTVWAQADVIKYLNSGIRIEDIGAGINTAMAQRIALLVNGVKPRGNLLMTGGVAKNVGVVSTLEKLLGMRIKKSRKADPQIAGAIGAALKAFETVINSNGRQK